MHTTLTLDDDVAKRLAKHAEKSGLTFKEVVNQTLRRGLAWSDQLEKATAALDAFKVEARSLGLRPSLSYDNIGELLERTEGAVYK